MLAKNRRYTDIEVFITKNGESLTPVGRAEKGKHSSAPALQLNPASGSRIPPTVGIPTHDNTSSQSSDHICTNENPLIRYLFVASLRNLDALYRFRQNQGRILE